MKPVAGVVPHAMHTEGADGECWWLPAAQLEPATVQEPAAGSFGVHLHSTVHKKWGRGKGETQFIGGGVLVDRGVRIDQVRNY
jgi:hypothetical protein